MKKRALSTIAVAGLCALFIVGGVVASDQNPPTDTPTPTPDQNQPAPQQPQSTDTPTPAAGVPTVPGRGGTGGTGGSGNSTDTPAHENVATCDACGYCNGMTTDNVPSRWESCKQCIYPGITTNNPLENQTLLEVPTPHLQYVYTEFGCISTEPGQFAAQISSFFFSVVGGIAFLFFIYGAGIIATSQSDPGRLNQGKRIIYGSIIGLLFALFAVFIIRFIATGIGLPDIG
jgi:hypothetical protein